MLKNYLKIAFRNLTKNKGISFINITGLAIGMACSIIIVLYIHVELSYDKQHSKAGRIFRALTIDKALGVSSNLVGITLPALAPAMKAEFPEVVETVRINRSGKNLIEYGQNLIYSSDLIYAEPSLFSVFDFKLLSGDKNSLLTRPNTAVITNEMAGKIFGKEDPIGKTFKIDNDKDIEVTGILEDILPTSHLKMDIVISILPSAQDSNLAQYLNSWGSISMTTYVLLNDANVELAVENKLEPLIRKNNVSKNFNVTLQPLADVHLKSSDILYDAANQNKSDISYIYSLFAVALFIILIAAFNFMNLSTARSTSRAKEVGLRKVIGAYRGQLIIQYLGESLLLCFISLFIALFLVELFIPSLNLPGIDRFIYFLIDNPVFILVFIISSLVLGLLAGVYPAFVLSKFIPIKVLKGSIKSSSSGIWLRRVLVVVQFAASIGMIIGTYVVYQQLEYIKSKNIGFSRDQVLIIDLNNNQLKQGAESFLAEVKTLSSVEGVSLSSTLPGRGFGRTTIQPEGFSSEDDVWIVSIMAADENFIPGMKMRIAEGRNFSKEFPSDNQNGVLINQAAAKAFSWNEPLGKKLSFGPNSPNQLAVVGVVEDFHFASMRHSIEPLIIVNNPQFFKNNISIRLKADNLSASIISIENIWKKINPNHPFEYSFLDNEFEQLYKTEQSFSTLIAGFAMLAIFIACLGLFGLASFITEQRTKEIGIRKVLGASVTNIILLTTKQFIILVLLANILVWPAAYYIMSSWLEDFAYRIDIEVWMFITAGISAIIIAFLTVSYQAIKAARANPVSSLKYE
jgi:putative ABC transport system permease protein